jgi:GNAT superfamily N-acetyltransferase
MSEVIVDSEIESGKWPIEFSGAWIEVIYDYLSSTYVASLYFDDRNEEGAVVINPDRIFELPLPQAYISWNLNGVCKEIYVIQDYRGRGIGTKLCAWARSYLLKHGVLFSAPDKMSIDASAMFQSISTKYGEPFTYPEESGILRGYSHWGYLV